MEISRTPHSVELKPGDEKQAMSLSIEAGWNQVEADWRHFILNGRTIGYRSDTGQLVATAAALPYEGPFGFIGMVIVTKAWRRRGLATKLVEKCISVLRDMNLVPVLDATEQGEPVYSQQGFVPQFRFDRWEIFGEREAPEPTGSSKPDPSRVADVDAAAFGARRQALMTDFLARADTIAVSEERAFGLIRRGRRACQAGPIVAETENSAIRMLDQLIAPELSVFVDVPRRWSATGEWLAGRGFRVQRSFARMALGHSEPFGAPEKLSAVAGPEFG